MSVGARIVKWQVLRAYAGPQYGPPQTDKIYSDPGSGLTTVDGFVERSALNNTWALIHDSFANNRNTIIEYMTLIIKTGGQPSKWANLSRAIMTFNLAGIPPGSIIQSACYCGYGYSKQDDWNWQPRIAVYQSHPLVDNNVNLIDYETMDNTPLSNIINYAGFTLTGFNYFTLNPAGLALLIPGQICRLGLREAKFDAPNVAPTPWVINRIMMFRVFSVDYATLALRPYLEVTYLPLL